MLFKKEILSSLWSINPEGIIPMESSVMDKLDYIDVEYYGTPIRSLNREGHLKAFAEYSTIAWECAVSR